MNYFIGILVIFSIIGIFCANQEPIIPILKDSKLENFLYSIHYGNSIIFDLSIGILTSSFFWFIVVFIPEKKRRNLLKNNFKKHYFYFKEDIVKILFNTIPSTNRPNAKELCDHQKFKDFFNSNEKEKWYAALNGLQSNQNLINDILIEMQVLEDEIAYLLNNINIDNENFHSYLKNLSTHIYRLKNLSTYTDDHVKYLGIFIWEQLAQWSCIDGQKDEKNTIEFLINEI